MSQSSQHDALYDSESLAKLEALGAPPWFLAYAAEEERQWQARSHGRWQVMRGLQLLRIGNLWLWVCSGLGGKADLTPAMRPRPRACSTSRRGCSTRSALSPSWTLPTWTSHRPWRRRPTSPRRSRSCSGCTVGFLCCDALMSSFRPRGPPRVLWLGAHQPLPEVPLRPVRGLRSRPVHQGLP
jgi:hypothetical protein